MKKKNMLKKKKLLIQEAKKMLIEFKEETDFHKESLKIYPNSTYRHPVLYLYYDCGGNIEFTIYHELEYPIDCEEPITEYHNFEIAQQDFINDIYKLIN